jgi:hypothetical protein
MSQLKPEYFRLIGFSAGEKSDKSGFMPAIVSVDLEKTSQKNLLDQARDSIRLKHYSLRTELAYCDWIERFIRFYGKRHPREMAEEEVTQFLTHLASEGNL